MKTHGLTHVALAVRDPQRSLAFYRKVIGVVPVSVEGGSIQAQTPGTHDRIRGEGEFAPGLPCEFCEDPDGYEIEIGYETPTPADPRPTKTRKSGGGR